MHFVYTLDFSNLEKSVGRCSFAIFKKLPVLKVV